MAIALTLLSRQEWCIWDEGKIIVSGAADTLVARDYLMAREVGHRRDVREIGGYAKLEPDGYALSLSVHVVSAICHPRPGAA